MRRIVSAIAPAIALVASVAPCHCQRRCSVRPDARAQQHTAQPISVPITVPIITAVGDSARHGIDRAGRDVRHVSWNWIRAASGYRIQIAKRTGLLQGRRRPRTRRNSRHRPAGGREAAVLGKLRDATYYWVRVRKLKGHHRSHVVAPGAGRHQGARARPDHRRARCRRARSRRDDPATGRAPASTPTSTASPPASLLSARRRRRRTAATARRSAWPATATRSPSPPRRPPPREPAWAAGRHLFFRILAVRKGNADTASRRYPFLLHTRVKGEHSSGNGTRAAVRRLQHARGEPRTCPATRGRSAST